MYKTKEIIIVADPMCSWCWGFEPVIESLLKNLPDGVSVSLLLGGLRSKGDQVWDEGFRAYLSHHWSSVENKTAQYFNRELLKRSEFDYDTEPSCRAVVTVRELDATKQFAFFKALQEAFYLQAQDITDEQTLAEIAEEEGFEKTTFLRRFRSQAIMDKTEADQYKARSMGANVFPSVVLIDEEGHLCVIKGYKSYDELRRLLE